MSVTRPLPNRGRRRLIGWVSGTVATALVVTLAVVANGFDSRETPREDPSVWVERSAGQYARVNTETAEIDTVRTAESPSGVVQTPELGLLLTQSFGRAWTIDPASPIDVRDDDTNDPDDGGEDADAGDAETATADSEAAAEPADSETSTAGSDADEGASIRTPDGTRDVIAEGDYVLFFTQSGDAYLSQTEASATGSGAALGSPVLLDPLEAERSEAEQNSDDAEDEVPKYHASAAALDANGLVALFSQEEQSIRWFDAVTGKWRGGAESAPEDAPAEAAQLAIVDGDWVLLDPANGRLWQQGREQATELELAGEARLQGSSTAEGAALVADGAGLWRVTGDGQSERVVEADGAAAQPREVAGTTIAAWIGAASARMWTSDGAELDLELDAAIEDLSNPETEIRSNGSRALVVERGSGMMWTVPDGKLIPVEQWSLVDPPKQETGTVVTQDVTEQEPPVAVDDAFGARAGEPVQLPVLLNDYDPNRKDVLTVVTEGLGDGLDAGFGTLSPLSDGQGILLEPSTAAQGSATFSYRVTDGVNVSPPATVTVTIFDEATNSAPQWCPVEGCQRSWPSPELAPGGTLVLPVLEGWVDPEGDPMMLASATVTNEGDPIRALVTADGKLAVRHTDANAPAGDMTVRVAVVDANGAQTERELRVRVRSGAAIEFAPAATTAKVGEATVVRPLERVTGGSGSFQLIDATVQQGSAAVTANTARGTVEVLASAAGNSLVAVTIRDSVTAQEVSGVIRVTAVESRSTFGVPPMRAFVRSLADTTVDVLEAVPGSNSRALSLQSATVVDGQLRADVIEHSRVRVSGSTFDGQPGRIGSVDLVIAEGDTTAHGRLTVFQVADSSVGAIAVTDTATVRAGSVVDIAVLDNDVAPPGERLVLHPEVGAPGAKGELAFASGSSVRYLAPKTPGEYTLSYTTYGASSPERSDVGQVRVTVLPAGSNRDPQPATVTVRVAPGEQVTTTVPLSGLDPDGDRVRLVSVDSPEDSQLSTGILSRSSLIQVSASLSAQRGTKVVNYTVRDAFGGEANGKLRIIVTEPDPAGGAPIVYSDYVRIAHGTSEAATVRPLDNDIDPSGGTLELVSVVPNVLGGEDTAAYRQLRERLDLSRMDEGIVGITGGDDLGTFSFKYTVRSSETKSTADGLIVVQVSERIGQQAPTIADTVLSVRDRYDFERSGVDVVTDRVRWAAGDVSTLTLSLWGDSAKRYEVSGSKIIGGYRAEGDLVTFRLSGTDMTGAEVESFGFLIVPPLDELRLSLKSNVQPLSVAENKSVDANIPEMLDLGPGDTVELDQAAFPTQRQQATCEATGTTKLRYTAGKEAPWSDICSVRVRLAEQTTYTVLSIPVNILPDSPVVQLNPLTRTVAPGASETIDLNDMVQWQGGRKGEISSLRWQVSGGGSAFEVSSSGSSVQAQARADAVPGTQAVLAVQVSGSGETQSLLTLRVGEAPVDAPRGGTVSLQCTVGSSCSTTLIGVGGEYDPFAGKSGGGLQLVSVDDGGCRFGSMVTSGNSVNVSWADSRGPGGSCTATFTVRDAQKRTGTGTIEFDAQGVPRAPTSIVASGASASNVTLTVTLNAEGAHPSVTGVEILNASGGTVASCTPSGGAAVCTVNDVPVGKENGRRYLARAINSVGASDPTAKASELTWAYVAPPAPNVDAQVVKNRNNTDQAAGKVDLRLSGSDRARKFLLSIDDGPQTEVGRTSTHTLAPGQHTLSVVPQDNQLPPGYQGDQSGNGNAGVATVTVGAAPKLTDVVLNATGENSAEIVYTLDENYASPDTVQARFGVSASGSPNCSSSTAMFTGLTKFRTYMGKICVSTEFGTTEVTTASTWIGGNPPALTVTRGYTLGGQVSDFGNVREYVTVGSGSSQPRVDGAVSGATIRYTTSAGTVSEGSLGSVPVGATVQVQQCVSGEGAEYCSDPVTVPAGGQLPTRITWSGVCIADGGDYSRQFTVEGRAATDATFAKQGSNNVRVTWASTFNQTTFNSVICAPEPDPEPEPEPDPEPDPGSG